MRVALGLLGLLLLAPGSGGAQETPRMGGVLKVATIGEAPTLDIPMSTATISYEIMWHVNESLFTYDAGFNRGRRRPLAQALGPGGLAW